MNEIYVHVTGVVATDVTAKMVDDVPLSSFRMVSTTRRFDRGQRTWVDGDKTWLTVTCWRALATNVRKSVLKSERVIVTGRLKVSQWRDEEGRARSRTEVVADAVGHDLTFGTTLLKRTPKVENLDPDPKELAAAQVAETLEQETENVDVDELLAGVSNPATSPDPLAAPASGAVLDLPEDGEDRAEGEDDGGEGFDDVLAALRTIVLPVDDIAPAPVDDIAPAPVDDAAPAPADDLVTVPSESRSEARPEGGRRRR